MSAETDNLIQQILQRLDQIEAAQQPHQAKPDRLIALDRGDQIGQPTPEAAPIPVADRLPGEGDCDTEGRCWLLHVDNLGLLEWHFLNRYPSLDSYSYYGYTHWLPHRAIPLPQAHPCP
jgi:hypothetical protein